MDEDEGEDAEDEGDEQDQRDRCFKCGGLDHWVQDCTAQRTYLRCPYSQRKQCKRAGGRWDPGCRKWYTYQVDLRPFARWR